MITGLENYRKLDKFFQKLRCQCTTGLQSAVYTLVTASLSQDPALVKLAYCVAETAAPYRVQFMIAGIDFVEAGDAARADEIIKFWRQRAEFHRGGAVFS